MKKKLSSKGQVTPGIVLARLAMALPTVELGADKSAPAEIQYLPPGEHMISASRDGKAVNLKVKVHAGTASVLAKALADLRAKAANGEGDLPFFDFDHKDADASAHPTEFYWGGDDSKSGGVRAKLEWTEPGQKAVTGHAYRRFSPSTFIDDKSGEVYGAEINMGGLVNRAAFRKIAPVWAKGKVVEEETSDDLTKPKVENLVEAFGEALAACTDCEDKIITTAARDKCCKAIAELLGVTPEFMLKSLTEEVGERGENKGGDAAATKAKESMTDEEKAAMTAKDNELTALKAKLITLEQAAVTHAKDSAKAIVGLAVAAGKIAPKDTALITHYEELVIAAPVQAKAIIEALPVNPALLTVVTGANNGGDSGSQQGGKKEHEFVVKAKAIADKQNITEAKAQEQLARSMPKLYEDWRDKLGN